MLTRRDSLVQQITFAATAAMFVWLSSFQTVVADNLTWDATAGGAINDGAGTWLNANQWNNGSPNITWNNGTPDNATIGNTGAGGTITLGAVTAGSLTFNSFTGTYTLSGGSLALNNGITANSDAGIMTISTPITLGGPQTWANNDDSVLTASGAMTINNLLTINSGGSGRIDLTNANTGAGGVKLSAGTLRVGNNAALGTGAVTLSGGTLQANGSFTVANSTTVDGAVVFDQAANPTSSNLALSGPVTLNSGAALTYTSSGGATNSFHAISGQVTLNTNVAANINSSVGDANFVRWTGGIDLNNATVR